MNNTAIVILGVAALGAVGVALYLATRPAPVVHQPSSVEQLFGGVADVATGVGRIFGVK